AAVTYLQAAKTTSADLAEGLLAQSGAVSEECAAAVATGVRARTGVAWDPSTTGSAGPTGADAQHPADTPYVGLAGPKVSRVERHHFHGDRERVQAVAAHAALDVLRRSLQGVSP